MSSSPACVCVSCPTRPGPEAASAACGFYPSSSLTDAQWSIIEPLLPAPGNTRGRGGRPEKHPRRLVLDAIFYLVRGGKGFVVLPRRWVAERTLAWISKHRRCVRDYETRPDHHEAMVYIS